MSSGSNRFSPSYDMVSGLLKFSVYRSDKYNKVIVLMGERHDKQNLCHKSPNSRHITVKDFLLNMIDSSPHIKDLFIEHHINPHLKDKKYVNPLLKYDETINREEDIPETKTFMADMINLLIFRKCMRTSKDEKLDCKGMKNLRVHISDIRGNIDSQEEDIKKYILTVWYTLQSCYYGSSGRSSPYSLEYGRMQYTKDELESIETTFKNKEEFISLILSLIERLKIDKQIEHIPFPEVKTFLNNYIKEEMVREYINSNDVEIYFSKIYQLYLAYIYIEYNSDNMSINERDAKKMKSYETILDSTRVSFDKCITSMMDTYLLARVFRTYNDGSTHNNAIIYTGSAHTENYEDILKRLGFNLVYSGKRIDDNSCIDITGLNIEWI